MSICWKEDIVPDNPNFKSASDVLKALVAKKARSLWQTATLESSLCSRGLQAPATEGRTTKLWHKAPHLLVRR